MSTTAEKQYNTVTLLKRFSPYLMKYRKLLFFDLFCAALTTLCDIVLPRIMSTLTNTAMYSPAELTVELVLKLALVYTILRLVDAAAYYYMSSRGHIMGVHIETDMRTDAFDHLERLSDSYYANTKIGQVMGRITSDLFDVTEFAHHCPEEFFIAGIKILVSFIILCQSSVVLTLIIFSCIPFLIYASIKLNIPSLACSKGPRVLVFVWSYLSVNIQTPSLLPTRPPLTSRAKTPNLGANTKKSSSPYKTVV